MSFKKNFAEHWDELIDWKKREMVEDNFLINILKQYNVNSVLDLATGTGFDSVMLLKNGFDVTSIDSSKAMLNVASQNAKKNHVNIKPVLCDWVDLDQMVNKKFDALICLGNSFACEIDPKKRIKSFKKWSDKLNDNGIIILDHRNYEFSKEKKINIEKKYYYLGTNVDITPTKINSKITSFKYTFSDNSSFNLEMVPIKLNYINDLANKNNLETLSLFGDRNVNYSPKSVNFYLHVLRKLNG